MFDSKGEYYLHFDLTTNSKKSDLIAFLSQIQPCPIDDAFIAAGSKGIVTIIDTRKFRK